MAAKLKYTVIRSRTQYKQYCSLLEELLERPGNRNLKDEIDLLTLLIAKWDEQHSVFSDLDPVQLMRSLITDHQLKSKDLVTILGVSKGCISDILNYKKGFSKESIRILSAHFKLNQAAFNRPYSLRK